MWSARQAVVGRFFSVTDGREVISNSGPSSDRSPFPPATAATPGTRAVGYTVAGNGTAKVSFAAPGDTNLDGLVNFSDIQAIINGGRYGQSGATGVWAVGDFNYDGLVNFTDIQGMLNAGRYGQASYFPAAPLGGLGELGGAGGIAAVPEPTGLALVVIAAALAAGQGCLRARRRAYTSPVAD